MTPEFVEAVGYASAFVLSIVAAAVAFGLASLLFKGRDDGYRWMGDPVPPPERRSPFAPDRDDAE